MNDCVLYVVQNSNNVLKDDYSVTISESAVFNSTICRLRN